MELFVWRKHKYAKQHNAFQENLIFVFIFNRFVNQNIMNASQT